MRARISRRPTSVRSHDRLVRGLLARVLRRSGALPPCRCVAGSIARPFAPLLRCSWALHRMAAMLRLTPHRRPRRRSIAPARSIRRKATRRGRVALLSGCVNPVLAPSTNEAAHPPAQSPRHRGGGRRRRSLLRLARPSHGPRGRSAGTGPQQYRRMDRARSTARARRHPRSPPPAAARRSRITASCCATIRPTPTRPRAFRRAPATSPSIWRRSILPGRGRRGRSRSPIMPPARCSTARRSSASRRSFSPSRVSS